MPSDTKQLDQRSGGGSGTVDGADGSGLKKLTGGSDERGQGTISVGRKECFGGRGSAVTCLSLLADELIKGVGTNDVDAGLIPLVAA